MNVETRPGSRQRLVRRVNGESSLTERGRRMHELALMDTMLKNATDPNVTFAISPELSIKYSKRLEELCGQLEIPEEKNARDKAIERYKAKLIQVGHPHWRLS